MRPENPLPYAEVIGDPVAHSKSPTIHRHWLRILGIAGDYVGTAVSGDALAGFLAKRRSDPQWRGCNVTIPHKESVLSLLDRLDEQAAMIGAVNCIVPREGRLVGFNTDVDGVAAALDTIVLEGKKAAIIGAGGAARAALAYLASRKTSEVVVLARDPRRALVLEELHPGNIIAASFDEGIKLFADKALIINASPLGMVGCPEMPASLLAGVSATPEATLFDMVYSPLRTAFLSAGRAVIINGLTMLVGQAARAFELFFGERPPIVGDRLQDLLIETAAAATTG